MQPQSKGVVIGDPLNCLVLKYLESRLGSGHFKGRGCAGDIFRWARKNHIYIDSKKPILWLNYRIKDFINISLNDHQTRFGMQEREGWGEGMNFEWWVK
jgi:hypothetical protein